MSNVFSFWCENAREKRVVSYFTTDRRRARRFARRTGIRFRIDRESQRAYGGGQTLGGVFADDVQEAARVSGREG